MKKKSLGILGVLFFILVMIISFHIINGITKSEEVKSIDNSREYTIMASISLDDDEDDDYEWTYKFKKDSIASIAETETYKGTTTFRIEGLKKGKTTLTFKYRNKEKNKDVLETVKYSLKVRKNKTIKLVKLSKTKKDVTLNEKDIINDVLNSNKKFTNEDGQEVTVNSFKLSTDEKIEVDKICYIDLDGDNIKEAVILTKSEAGIYYIFHIISGNQKVYGYEINYRALEDLKVDGSFVGSNGANNQEYYSGFKFDKNSYKMKEKALFDEDDKIYKLNGKDSTKEEVLKYIDEFNKKEEAKFE